MTSIAWLYYNGERFVPAETEDDYAAANCYVIPDEADFSAGFEAKSGRSWYPVYQGKALKRHRDVARNQ